MTLPPYDEIDDQIIAELLRQYEATAKKLDAIILHPPGIATQEFNRSRVQIQLSQVKAEIARLKNQAAAWTGPAVTDSITVGKANANDQVLTALKDAGLSAPDIKPLRSALDMELGTSWAHVDTGAIKILAQQTLRDLNIGAAGMEQLSANALAKIEALKVSPRDISDILGGRIIIEGKPAQGVRELRDKLLAIHGKKTVIPCKDGIDREYDTKSYAELVARTRTRDIVRESRHGQFESLGADLVKIVGTISKYPCTRLVGHIFSLSGRDEKYPALSTVSESQEPYRLWHPHCGKRTQVYIASAVAMRDRIRARIESLNSERGLVATRSVAA